MNIRLWIRLIWRDVRFHPILWGLSILGIAVGVGGWLGMESATNRATSAFENSIRTTFGNATHVVENRMDELRESQYFRLSRTHSGSVTPILETYGRLRSDRSGTQSESIRVVGIDPLSYGQFQPGIAKSVLPLDQFLAGHSVVVLSPDFQDRFQKGDRIRMTINNEQKDLRVAGFFTEDVNRRTVFMDIGFLQHYFRMEKQLTRVLIKAENSETVQPLKEQLSGGAVLYPTGRRTRSVRSMLGAFRWNLRALSLLALFVGGFLVYSTMYLYASRQTRMISLLKTMGTSRGQIGFWMLGGLGVLGVVGSLLGVGFGLLVSGPIEGLVRGTVDRLYVPLFARGESISAGRLLGGFFLGIVMTFAGGIKPILSRLGVPPGVKGRTGSGPEQSETRFGLLFGCGIISWGIAALLFMGTNHIVFGFISCFLIAFGGSLMSPMVLSLLSTLPTNGIWTRIAFRNIRFYGAQTSIMVAVLVAAFSLVLAVSFMVSSFRNSVNQWINSVVRADYYVRSAPESNLRRQVPLDRSFLEKLRDMSGVKEVGLLAEKTIRTEEGKPLTLRGMDPDVIRERLKFQFNKTKGDPWKALQKGRIWLSEPGAFRLGRSTGDFLSLPVPEQGNRRFRIGAVFNDYSTEWAIAYMDLSRMQEKYNDVTISSVAVFTNGTNIQSELQSLAAEHEHFVESGRGLKQKALSEFDRTFAVTDVMKIMASFVAGIGLLILLISFIRSRAWVFGRMSTTGASRFSISSLVTGESLIISVGAIIVAIPTGLYLSYVLIRVINRRSFGWLIPFQFRLTPLFMLIALLGFTLVIALAFPVYRLMTVSIHDLLQETRE